MMPLFGLALLLLGIAGDILCVSANEYYFTEPNGEQCPDNENCYTFGTYSSFKSNAVYYFLPGNHEFATESLMIINAVNNVTFQGMGEIIPGNHSTIMESTVVLKCSNFQTGILLFNSSQVTFRDITLIGCGGSLGSELFFLLVRIMRTSNASTINWMRYRMAIAIVESNQVELERVSIQQSMQYGLVTVNAYNMTIKHCSFAYNNIRNYGNSCMRRRNCFGGNALLVYTLPIECRNEFNVYKTHISYSNFSFGFDSNQLSRFTGSGLSIYLEQADAYGIDHVIENTILYGNSGALGSNFRFTVTRSVVQQTLTLASVTSVFANEVYVMDDMPSTRIYGTGMYIYIGRQQRRNTVGSSQCFNGSITPVQHVTTVSIIDSISSNNNGAFGTGLYFFCDSTAENQYSVIENCEFNNNRGFAGAGLLLVQENNLNYRYRLKNVAISNSRKLHLPNFGFTNIASAIMLRRLHNVSFYNLIVTNNPYTGMFLLNSQATFLGNDVVFSNNTALSGGGMQLHGDSSIILESPVSMTFKNNIALRSGGGIFVLPSPYITIPCFFQPSDLTKDSEGKTMSISFSGNIAKMGGDIIYGANIASCYLTRTSRFYNPVTDTQSTLNAENAFNEVFKINEQATSQSLISSSPEYVCFCFDGQPNCTIRNLYFTTFPGSETVFNIVPVGETHGTTPGIVNTEEIVNGTIVINKDVLSSNINCTEVRYVAPGKENITIDVNYFINQVNTANNLSVKVEVSTCPIGFQLIDGRCGCNNETLQLENEVTCDQTNASFKHDGNIWIGYKNDTDCFVTTSTCPFEYCVDKSVTFTIETQDQQCQNHRSGVQCGTCAEGYTLKLGTNDCGKCTDNYLALLIVFALAGIALVLFLLILNMTVSFGTINGCIFYANIVKLSEGYIFPEGPIHSLQIFISWFNLDFGIPTCFTENLDSELKASLQLVFPFYLWGIMIVIAIMVHFSSRLTKLLGRKVIPVMATLILLSFTKMLRTCVLVWRIAYLQCNGIQYQVWAFDPNIMYWSPKHAAMIIITVVIFVFLIVPYTLVLLLSPLIERYLARFKIFKWWIKLKPFIDAYDGPYRDKYRYWTGLLLLIRVILVPVFAARPLIGIQLIVIMAALLLSIMAFTSGLYRHRALDALEIWYILQLVFITSQRTGTNLIPCLSIIPVIITATGVTIFHILYQLNLTEKIKTWILQRWNNRKKMEEHLGRTLSAYTKDLLESTQKPRYMTSVRISERAKYNEDGSWVINKRESLLQDYSDSI